MRTAAVAARGQAERDREAGVQQVRRELKTFRRLRQQEPDADRRRYLSRRLWDYEKAFRKQREEYYDEKAAERNSLGRHGKRQRGMQRGTLPTHLRDGSGVDTARSDWLEMFATFWGRHWGAGANAKPRSTSTCSGARFKRCADDEAHRAPTASCTGCSKICQARTMDARAKWERGADNHEWDHAPVTFVAKVKHPMTVSQWRPITLANHLKHCINWHS